MIRIVLAGMLCTILATPVASAVAAQETSQHLTVALGLVSPHKSLGAFQTGIVARAGLERLKPTSHWRFRLDGEGMWMKARPSSAASTHDALFAAGLAWNVMGGPIRQTLAPYALIGIGVQALLPRGSDVYAGGLASARFGGGIRGQVGRLRVSVETSAQLGLFSSYGPISSSSLMLWPATVSVTF